MNNENFNLAAMIAKNAADEEEAIQGYYELMPLIMDKADQDVIKEIISDEKNHAMLLRKMMAKYDSNIPVATDDPSAPAATPSAPAAGDLSAPAAPLPPLPPLEPLTEPAQTASIS
ncbi:hypothetical protein FWG76_01120 [Candidatus Saccharibacteria bacterium]|nr:hypothetical protein [Candidatus Saccharibacteria bacterium]